MSREDEYRRLPDEAQRQAERAVSDLDRASWLRLAHGWLSLLRQRPRTPEEQFDDAVMDKGTGQQNSDTSN